MRDRANLQPGDVIRSVEGVAIVTAEQLAMELDRRRGSEAWLTLLRDGREAGVSLRYPPATTAGTPPATVQPAAMPMPAAPVLRALAGDEIVAAQRLLNELGFDTGGADGVIGPTSRTAMQRFARSHALRERGGVRHAEPRAPRSGAGGVFHRLTRRGRHRRAAWRWQRDGRGRALRARFGRRARDAAGPDRAAFWYGLAAQEHEPRALNQLGQLLVRGQGVAQDAVGGSLLWRLAASRGDATAAFNLGAMLERGIGLARSPGWARFWYDLAPQAGHPAGARGLAAGGAVMMRILPFLVAALLPVVSAAQSPSPIPNDPFQSVRRRR